MMGHAETISWQSVIGVNTVRQSLDPQLLFQSTIRYIGDLLEHVQCRMSCTAAVYGRRTMLFLHWKRARSRMLVFVQIIFVSFFAVQSVGSQNSINPRRAKSNLTNGGTALIYCCLSDIWVFLSEVLSKKLWVLELSVSDQKLLLFVFYIKQFKSMKLTAAETFLS